MPFIFPAWTLRHSPFVPQLIAAASYSEADDTVINPLIATWSAKQFGTLSLILDHGSSSQRVLACYAIGRIGGPEAFPLLHHAFADQDIVVRKFAVYPMRNHPCAQARIDLLVALADGDWVLRTHAVNGLAMIGDATAIPALRQVEEADPREDIRAGARRAIASIEQRTRTSASTSE
jgi:HEAT repeat protein